MSHFGTPPFPRGQTLFNKPYSDTSLTTSMGTTVEGQIWTFDDVHPTTGARRSNRRVTCLAVRWTGDSDNSAGNGNNAALPKHLAVLDAHRATNVTGATNLGGTNGLCRSNQMARFGSTLVVNSAKCYPIDEYLPTTGVAENDIFWLVIDGPATVYTPNAEFTAFAIGSALVALTQTTAVITNGSTLVGRAAVIDNASTLGGTTSILGVMDRIIGMALSACTSQGYRQDILCDVGSFKY